MTICMYTGKEHEPEQYERNEVGGFVYCAECSSIVKILDQKRYDEWFKTRTPKTKTYIVLSEEKQKRLREANIKLQIAMMIINDESSGIKPFRASKLLNVMHKEIRQHTNILRVLLGAEKFSRFEWEFKNIPTFKMLEMMKKDGQIE